MPDTKKKVDPKYIRKTLNVPIIQFISEELFRKALNDSLQSIVDFINQDKMFQLAELGWYIDNPEDGMFIFASGWTEIVSAANGLKRNSGFHPSFLPDHKETTGILKAGRGLWFRADGAWRQVTLVPAIPVP
ncbi:MAG: hypothetical protein ACHQ1D_01720 [Nitrososphaerales archaeon]|jgi:hypothetical protein